MYLSYRGYVGTAQLDVQNHMYFGNVDTSDEVQYCGRTMTELQKNFRQSVDEYIAACALCEEPPSPARYVNVSLRVPSCMAHKGSVSVNDVLDLVRETIILE